MFVLQEWLKDVGCKQQSILMSGLRSPDHQTVAIKQCVRWLRAQCQVDADPTKQGYMKTVEIHTALMDRAIEELEYCAVHYAHHFADAFAVVAFNHPDQVVVRHACYLYSQVAEECFHFHPMTKEEFITRHRDRFKETS